MIYTVAQVAERCTLHPDTVRDLIKSGELEAFNVSKKPNSLKPRYRIRGEALEAFESRRSVNPPAKQARPRRPVKTFRRWI